MCVCVCTCMCACLQVCMACMRACVEEAGEGGPISQGVKAAKRTRHYPMHRLIYPPKQAAVARRSWLEGKGETSLAQHRI